jgi:nitrite reductase/ring-hydroxylating ferredoxin subunit
MKHPICRVEEVPETGTRVFGFFGREVHVWRARGKIRAAANACLHLGGPLECKDGALVCPWHGARYSLDDGHRTDGPGPEGARLMFLPIRVEDGAVTYVWGED